MVLLGLDPGTENFGWAVGRPGHKPIHGTHRPPSCGMNLAALLVDIRALLHVKIKTHGVTCVAYEAPIMIRFNGFPTIRKMCAIGAGIELTCHDLNVECFEADMHSVRKHFLGKGNTPRKSKEIKAAVMDRCRVLGWAPANDHEGDALAVTDFALAIKGSRLHQMGLLAS